MIWILLIVVETRVATARFDYEPSCLSRLRDAQPAAQFGKGLYGIIHSLCALSVAI